MPQWIEVTNPMDRTIVVEVAGREVAVKPDSTIRVKAQAEKVYSGVSKGQ